MQKIIRTTKESFYEFKNVKVLTAIGMLGALSIVINNFTIQIGDIIKIGFSSECNVMVDCLFGPVVGAIFGAGMDILKFIIRPTGPYFWGWTFSALLAGLIIGFGLYKKKITYTRVLVVRMINSLLVNVLLGTYWLNIMYGKAFLVLLPSRLLKNLIMTPIEALIFVVLYKALERSGVFQMISQTVHKNKVEA